jgi:DNA invertase Pin-like site-specific DNA recombinase
MPPQKTAATDLIVPAASVPARAAVYVRMSTEHQQYSIHNQMVMNQHYAIAHGMEIVRIYSDEGFSGLSIERRAGVQRLMDDVRSGRADFDFILVYDVSRWGRFQDTDQGAHYEFECRQQGIKVNYCAEPFENDNTPMTAVIKSIKRAMAAEYSRELGVKVFQAQCNLARRGFDLGGGAPYGLKHVIVDKTGKHVAEVLRGMQKAIGTDRVILAPGPRNEVKVVRLIFDRYVNHLESTVQVARYLNVHGFRTRADKLWVHTYIRFILRNEKYIGTQTYNRTSARLHTKRIFNDPATWIKTPNAFKAIVDPELFDRAQQLLDRRRMVSNEELLSKLRRSVRKHGVMTYEEMRKCRGVPGPGIFAWRFGSLANAYALIGEIGRAPHIRRGRQKSKRLGQPIVAAVLRRLQEDNRSVSVHDFGCRIRVDSRWDCRLHIARRRMDRAKTARWPVRLREQSVADFHLIARESADGESIMDYYVLPAEVGRTFPTVLKSRNGAAIDRFRVRDLSAAIEAVRMFLLDR